MVRRPAGLADGVRSAVQAATVIATAEILARWEALAPTLGLGTGVDLERATLRAGVVERSAYSEAETEAIIDQLVAAARRRRPDWRTVTLRDGRSALVPVPLGRARNWDRAAKTLKHAAAEAERRTILETALQWHAEGLPWDRVAVRLAISRSKLYKILRQSPKRATSRCVERRATARRAASS
jgi:hypothetical protein